MNLKGLGIPGTTVEHTSTATAQQLTDITSMVMQSEGRNAEVDLITVETNPIGFSWGTDPVIGGVGHYLPKWEATNDSHLILEGSRMIADFRFITYSGTSHGVMNVTPFFRP